eukprot:scaffold318875_cov22-Tisochrysis_lutea.AAC.1
MENRSAQRMATAALWRALCSASATYVAACCAIPANMCVSAPVSSLPRSSSTDARVRACGCMQACAEMLACKFCLASASSLLRSSSTDVPVCACKHEWKRWRTSFVQPLRAAFHMTPAKKSGNAQWQEGRWSMHKKNQDMRPCCEER